MSLEDSITTRDHNIGIWVCDAGASLISHALLMRSVCTDFPRHKTVGFRQLHNEKHQYFRNHNPVEFYYCEYGYTHRRKNYIHLFGVGEAAAMTFLKECDLSDFNFSVEMAGIILIIAKRTIDSGFVPTIEIDWTKKQNLPVVIAATGFDYSGFSENELRQHLNLESQTRVIPGPAIAMEQDYGFDTSYTKRILELFG